MYFPVVIHKDKESGYGATIPDIPGCFTVGGTLDEALANIQEAVECHLEGETEVPKPSSIDKYIQHHDYKGGVWVLVDIDLSFLSGKTVRINITVPERILRKIDKAAKKRGVPRSVFLVDAASKIAER
ncbi:MAG: type II toxin-antitoxin system HicB family antitoxin [Candidatus Brocadia sp.]|nr:type II toxin-antitoxin system HicB family antitoxin [Candidatus Brocadia sp.]UJS18285.1 MAG: type II toxin-antitoxin system HicB family antitoxin [Candidatus Jettenia sp.]